MKHLWRTLKSPSNNWVQLVSRKYLKQKSLLDYVPASSSSWQWRNLMGLREIFFKDLQWQLGDGRSIRFWKDCWVFHFPPVFPSPEALVCDFIDSSKNWMVSKLVEVLPQNLVDLISHLQILEHQIDDSRFWRLTPSSEFSTKSAALLAQGIVPENIHKVSFDWIWKLNLPPKVKNFLWKALCFRVPRLCKSRRPCSSSLLSSGLFRGPSGLGVGFRPSLIAGESPITGYLEFRLQSAAGRRVRVSFVSSRRDSDLNRCWIWVVTIVFH